jgi:RNA polymerase sigma-70 factor (family 1)
MRDPIHQQLLLERIAVFGDQSAYKKLFQSFYKDLNRFAYSFVKSNETAEEIVLDVFANVWKNRERLLEIQNLKVYLYVAVKNLSIKHTTRNNQHDLISLDELSVDISSTATYANPEEICISSEIAAAIHAAIEELPPRCKIIYKLVREDGLRYKEVADILQLSVKTVDAQMTIATKKICRSINFAMPIPVKK